jgi:calcineurin-like phosphoesterase family protein
MIYVTADLHFGHFKIIQYCNRPFKTLEEMNETLINNWNNIVTKKDEIYVLGDFGFLNITEYEKILPRLNGKKYLIRGNHDNQNCYQIIGWKNVKDYLKLRYNNVKFILSHYPMVSWDSKNHGSIMLHGHCHGTLNRTITDLIGDSIIDVGVDVWNYTPVSLDSIIELVNQRRKNHPKSIELSQVNICSKDIQV